MVTGDKTQITSFTSAPVYETRPKSPASPIIQAHPSILPAASQGAFCGFSPSIAVGAATGTTHSMPALAGSDFITPLSPYSYASRNHHYNYGYKHTYTYTYPFLPRPPHSPSHPPLPSILSTEQTVPSSLAAHCAAPVVMPSITSAKRSVYATCIHCRNAVTTQIRYRTGSATWLGAACFCILAFYVCGCLWPFCCNCTKDVIHHCPVCKGVLSRYQRL